MRRSPQPSPQPPTRPSIQPPTQPSTQNILERILANAFVDRLVQFHRGLLVVVSAAVFIVILFVNWPLRPASEVNHDQLDYPLLVTATLLVYFMQLGFVAFEVGEVPRSYRSESAVKNLVVFISAFTAYVLVGHKIQGLCGNTVLAKQDFGGLAMPAMNLAFHAGFACTVALIVANALTGRTTILAHVLLASLSAGVGYPFLSALLWENGCFFRIGFVDWAGAAIVHIFGGSIGLFSALWVGSRFHTQAWSFLDKPKEPDQRSLSPLSVVGGLFLMFGWLGFNSGNARSDDEFSTAFLNTCLGACSGAFASLLLYAVAYFTIYWKEAQGRATEVSNTVAGMGELERVVVGMMGGLVSVTANANVVPYWGALLESFAGGLVAVLGSCVISARARTHLDDPLGAVATHGGAGCVGVLLTPFLVARDNGPSTWDFFVVQLQGCLICISLGCVLAFVVRTVIWMGEKLPQDTGWPQFARLRISSCHQATGKHGTESRGPAPRVRAAEYGIRQVLNRVSAKWDVKSARRLGGYLMAEGRELPEEMYDSIIKVIHDKPQYGPRERFALVAIALAGDGNDFVEGCYRLRPRDIIDLNSFADILYRAVTSASTGASSGGPGSSAVAMSTFVHNNLTPATKELLATHRTVPKFQDLETALVDDLNSIIKGELLYNPARVTDVTLSSDTTALCLRPPDLLSASDREWLNRTLLAEAYPNCLAKNLLDRCLDLARSSEGAVGVADIGLYREIIVWTLSYLAEELATSSQIIYEDTKDVQAPLSRFRAAETYLRHASRGAIGGRRLRRLASVGVLDLECSPLGAKRYAELRSER